jgi:hypothetical protein
MPLQMTRSTTYLEHKRKSDFTGKDEMNLAEFPFASLRNRGDTRKALIYKGWVTDSEGRRYEQEWITQGGSLVGIPNEFDERVFIALVAITAEQQFESRQVAISLYQVINIMGLSRSKNTYNYLEKSLERLLAATFTSKQAFWDHEREERITTVKGFHLIDGYWLRYKETDRGVAEEEGVPGYIVWNEVIWKSFKAGYIKNLDLDFFYSLESPVSRRLYRFLDKRMQYQDTYEIDIFDLSGRLGMVRYQYPSKVIEKLKPALDELTLRGFLKSAKVVTVKKYTRLRFARGEELLPAPSIAKPEKKSSKEKKENNSSGEPDPKEAVLSTLAEWGISERAAQRIANRYSEERITEKIEFLEFLQATNQSAVKRPSGWLRKAIEENYAAPDGFRSRAEREAEQQAKEEERARLRERAFSLEERGPRQSWSDQVVESLGVDRSLQALTEDLKHVLELEMTKATFDTHVARVLVTGMIGSQVTIAVPNRMTLEWLDGRLKPQFERALTKVVGEPVTINFLVPELQA